MNTPLLFRPLLVTPTPASAADWSTYQPVVTELTVEKLAQPLAEAPARIQVRFADQGLPAVLPLHLDRTERTLRDDGQGAYPVAGDGRYAAMLPLDAGPLAALDGKVRQQPALLDRKGRFPGHRLEGREPRPTAAVAPISSAARQNRQPTPPPASRPTPAPNRLQPQSHRASPPPRILFPHHPFQPTTLNS